MLRQASDAPVINNPVKRSVDKIPYEALHQLSNLPAVWLVRHVHPTVRPYCYSSLGFAELSERKGRPLQHLVEQHLALERASVQKR